MFRQVRIIFITWVLLYTLPIAAQVNTTYNIRRYGIEEGLPQTTVLSLFEDSRGFLWIGTSGGGISRFDGRHFTNYAANEGLDGVIVNAISEDSKGLMWIGTSWSGLCRYDGKTFKAYKKGDGLFSNGVQDVFLGHGNQFMIATDRGLFKMMKDDRFMPLTWRNESPGSVHRIVRSANGTFFIAGNNGIFRSVKDDQVEKVVYSTPLKPSARVICSDANGDIYFADNRGGVWKISQDASNPVSPEPVPLPFESENEIRYLFVDSNHELWVATQNHGVYIRRHSGWIHLGMENGLPSATINCIIEDRNHCYWLGSNDQGVFRFYDLGITGYSGGTDLQAGRVFGLAATAKGIVGGLLPEGAFLYDDKRFVKLSANTRFPFTAIAFTRDNMGQLVCASEKEVFVLKDDKPVKLSYVKIPDEGFIRSIHYARDGSLWVGTKYSGVYRFKDQKVDWFHVSKGNIESNNVYAIVEDIGGGMWFGTSAGVQHLINENIELIKSKRGLCNPYAGCLRFDKHGNLWVGTDRCVSVYKQGQFINLSDSGFAPNGPVYSLLIDPKGHVWVGTNTGVHQIICDENGHSTGYRSFSMNEGFAGIECNSRAICMDSLENIYVGTVKGIYKIDTRELSRLGQMKLPRLILEDVFIDRNKTNWTSFADTITAYYGIPYSIKLPAAMNSLNIKNLCIDKWNAGEIQYSYKLEGWDQSWSEPFSGELAIYRNLTPGKYVFRARAKAKGAAWTYLEMPLVITILKPVWQELWFIGLCLIFLVLAGFLFLKARQIRRNLEREKLETMIRLRTEQIQKQNEEKEILLKEIHHRVKNNLQVIISLLNLQSSNVTDEKALEAFSVSKSRLRTIALIHEKLYRSSDFEHINLNDYFHDLVNDLIETYTIDIKVHLDLKLNVEALDLNTLVPLGLILNEVISNSLKYAFEGKDNGIISISLGPHNENTYVLEIGDDGVGYEWSEELTKRGSLGLELIRILVEQMDGKITRLNRAGTWYHIYFKLQKG